MSTIGIPIESPEDFDVLGNLALTRGETIEVPTGVYHRLNMGSGAQIWAFTDHDGTPHSLSPHFDAGSRFEAEITAQVVDPNYPFDGGFHAWAEPDGQGAGTFPFVFDVPDFQAYHSLTLPALRQVSLAAFAHELELFEDEEAFAAHQGEPQMAPQSFVPSGLFTTEEQPVAAAYAIFAGRIKGWERRWNEVTGEPFASFEVETLGGRIDLVADFDVVPNEPVIGGLVLATAWLSGRVIPVQ